MPADDFVEDRIRWRIGQHFSELPRGRTYLFEQLSDELRLPLAAVASQFAAGKPVIAAVDSSDRWTLIGTGAVASRHSGRIHACPLTDLADLDIRDSPPNTGSAEEKNQWKGSWEYFRVTTKGGEAVDLWFPAGCEAYALWSVLLMLLRMHRGSQSSTE
jgi:hypothetical protein